MADDIKSGRAALSTGVDFFEWTQAQARALREAGEAGRLPPDIDWAQISEEVGDIGRRDLRRAESLVQRIVEHLYLLE
jgi:hypothetical protein